MIQEPHLPLREAARRAGLSLPTLRRRIRSGRLRAVLRRGPFGDQWEVPETELVGLGARSAPDQTEQGSDHASTINHDQPFDPAGSRQVREEAAYWRGRWEELREVLERLGRSAPGTVPVEEPADEAGALREALRQKSHELAHARNLVDSLRREKARLEGEVQALRDRQRPEPTLVDAEPACRAPRFSR